MTSVWLVDADNQSPALAATTANLLGWPTRIVLAGLPTNLRSWQDKAGIPEGVELESWESPAIPDGADVLLAMAAGCAVKTMERVVIFSRDGLVAGTLGRLLHARGVHVLAVSAMTHPGLPYPHLTLPQSSKCAATPMPRPVIPADGNREEYANEVFASIFAALGHPRHINRSNFFNHLAQRGFGPDERADLQAHASHYKEVGTGTERAILRRSSAPEPVEA